MRISDWSSDVCSSDLDRRRTHDMNTANWIPDLFMKRVFDDGPWTLFSPSDVPDLHDLTGRAFEERYEYYEELTKYGKTKLLKTLPAKDLWRKMISMLRTEERRDGKECVRTCRARGSGYHEKKTQGRSNQSKLKNRKH